MSGQVLAIAVIAAVAAYCLVRSMLRTPARLAPRLEPYTDGVRGRLGTVVPRTATPARSVWGPIITAAADRLGKVLDAGTLG